MAKIEIYILAGLLFLAVLAWPYDFYMVLKVMAFAAFMRGVHCVCKGDGRNILGSGCLGHSVQSVPED